MEHCYACGKKLRPRVRPFEADTRDAQVVYVGPECFRHIAAAGELGFQPEGGGPRLYPVSASTVRASA